MMKKTKKFLALTLALAAATTSMVGCGKTVDDYVPEGRTQIRISMYVGGYGSTWMDNLINELNNSQETYWYTRNADHKMASDEITGKIRGGVVEADIYFTTPADVELLVGGEYLEDLTPVLNYTPTGESLAIKDKMYGYDVYQKNFSDANGMYVIPCQYNVNSLVYDHDLFETMLWLKEDSNTENGLTVGADGIEGTYDDGLPVTYEEFNMLVQQIAIDQCIPFVYADTVGWGQMAPAVEAIWAQYEGLDNYKVGGTYNGTYVSPSTNTSTPVTAAEGWKVYANNLQEGRWKAMQYATDLYINSGYMYGDNSGENRGLDFRGAQGKFVLSHNAKSIAMLLDGCWWENEARRDFADDAALNNADYGYGKRDFRLMPVPKFDGQHESSDGKHYFQGGAGGSAFAIKQTNEVKKAGVLEFFKAYASDWNCVNYTKSCGALLPFKYNIEEDDMQNLSLFAQNVIEVAKSENTVLVDPYWYTKEADLNVVPERWGSITLPNGKTYGTHLTALLTDISLDTYKSGVLNYTYTQSNWTEKTR